MAKITGAFNFVIDKIIAALKPILDPIEKAITKALKPLVQPLLDKLNFPPRKKLPKKPLKPGFMTLKKGVNPFALYHTCAFNLEWVKHSGYNRCVCCIMGTMNPKKKVMSLMMYAFKEKLCRLMQHGLKEPIHLSPTPTKCWSKKAVRKMAREQRRLKRFEAAQARNTTYISGTKDPMPMKGKEKKGKGKKKGKNEGTADKSADGSGSEPATADKSADGQESGAEALKETEKYLEEQRKEPEEKNPFERAAEAEEEKQKEESTVGAQQVISNQKKKGKRISLDAFKVAFGAGHAAATGQSTVDLGPSTAGISKLEARKKGKAENDGEEDISKLFHKDTEHPDDT